MELTSIRRNMGDSELDVSLAKKGDKKAFERLIENNKSSMFRVALSILGNKQDIEDAIQNAIIKAYEGIIYLRKNEYFKTWLIRILINECKTILRNNKRMVPTEEINLDVTSYESFAELELTNAVNSLERDLRIVTTLFYFEDICQKDIARVLDIPEGTVGSRLSRARNKLYEMLKER